MPTVRRRCFPALCPSTLYATFQINRSRPTLIDTCVSFCILEMTDAGAPDEHARWKGARVMSHTVHEPHPLCPQRALRAHSRSSRQARGLSARWTSALPHEGHYDEHVIAVSADNPDICAPIACQCGHDGCEHPLVPHGDHYDYLVDGRLHHPHGDHCDDHGPVTVV